MFKYSLLSYLVSEELLFFPPPLCWPCFESPYSGRKALYETYNIPVVKNTIDLLFFSEHKLYGLSLSVNKDYDHQT